MPEDRYRPIPCELHSRYELAVLRRRALTLAWRDPAGATHLERVLPLDVRTRAGAEYLLVRRADGRELEVRLDRILHAEPLPAR
ncbi:MAG TPA: transcriptional antiterminator, Rof [Chromatiales bacterium]|nr:transcriptional antiterminator, Rof [Chromatiales bacterium]